MPVTYTPLRYPGGKNGLAGYLRDVMLASGLTRPAYAEPYCGGGGAALNLLVSGQVSEVYLNDIDLAVYSFWRFCISDTENLCDRIMHVPLSIAEWEKQKRILLRPSRSSSLDLAFATLFLNRVNRSGILRGGVIGGRAQDGTWRMGARFNRSGLAAKVRLVGAYRNQINVSRYDALTFLRRANRKNGPLFVYLDPPYVAQGRCLYRNHYNEHDHRAIAKMLQCDLAHPWVVSYDLCPLIQQLYDRVPSLTYSLIYSAATSRTGREVMFFGRQVRKPSHRAPKDAARAVVHIGALQHDLSSLGPSRYR